MSNISTIILNWNKSEMTISLLKQFLNIEGNNTDLVVVDNNSINKEKHKLISFFKEKKWVILNESDLERYISRSKGYLILLSKNYGYAKGNNFGLKLSKKLGYRYSLISNNDIKLEHPVIKELVNKMQSLENVAVIGPRILGPEGREQGPYEKPTLTMEFLYRVFYPLFYLPNKIYHLVKKTRNDADIYFPYCLSGCFMLVDLSVFGKIGYFDENTFLYAEELILAEKLKKIGYKMAYYPKVYVRHLHGASTIEFGNKKRFFIQLESDLYYYKKYRNYNKIQLFLVQIGRKTYFYIWSPLIQKTKRLFNRG